MDAKRQRLDDSLARPAPSSFAPSPTFTGRRPGFFFSRGPGGAVGYWPDARQQAAAGLMPPPPPRPPAAPAPAPDGAALLAAAEAAVDPAALAELDGRAVRRLVLALERRARDNLEARLAHAAQPQRFLDSEVRRREGGVCDAVRRSPPAAVLLTPFPVHAPPRSTCTRRC